MSRCSVCKGIGRTLSVVFVRERIEFRPDEIAPRGELGNQSRERERHRHTKERKNKTQLRGGREKKETKRMIWTEGVRIPRLLFVSSSSALMILFSVFFLLAGIKNALRGNHKDVPGLILIENFITAEQEK